MGLCEPCYSKQYRETHPEVREKAWSKRGIDMTTARYDELLKAQGGGCAICHRIPKKGKRRLDVDHDHKTGVIRGLLCYRCNYQILGPRVTREILRSAIDYLDKSA